MATTKSPRSDEGPAATPSAPPGGGGEDRGEGLLPRLIDEPSARLWAMHRAQVHRDRWPDFDAFDRPRYADELLRSAAVQWSGRARNEHGSVHQFSALTHAFTEARVPAAFLGGLARLITDEVRHAELCTRMALACDPEGMARSPAVFRWPRPRAPWPRAPSPMTLGGDRSRDTIDQAIFRWAADAIVCACCIGETLSRPMLAAVEMVATDPVAQGVAAQILRDEHLHATFGWECLSWLVPRLDDEGRAWLRERLPGRFAGFERSTALGIRAEAIAGREITIAPGDAEAAPNLGTLSAEQYAVIFFATFEQEILPGLRDVGLDADWAWAARLSLLDAARGPAAHDGD
ncbi:MAG: hypothetical protein RIF41_06755 [Polyangiaceae bacterium]